MTAHLARIDIYPIKSLDGLTVRTADVLPSGALKHDRAYALFDPAGNVINGKCQAQIHQVRSRFAADITQVTLWTNEVPTPKTFHLHDEIALLEQWLAGVLQQSIALQQNRELGFPDDIDSPGPTIISTATLQTVADWYGLSLAETRQRFRTNLEIDGVPAFWEDRLFADSGEPVAFQVGPVTFCGINPCQRCVVPTRDSQTGEAIPGFQKRFIEQRAASLPTEVARSRFNHFYRLAVNTRVLPDSALQSITIGDPVQRL
jgi:uncharacterized protein YcbX